MSKFYTYASRYGNNIITRGYENGIEFRSKIPFSPSLFMPAESAQPVKTLDGRNAVQITFEDMNDAKSYIKKYSDVAGFEIHGMQNFEYQYIAETYEGDIEYHKDQMRIWSLDIETMPGETGFTSPDVADSAIVLISVQDMHSKEIRVWGFKPYTRLPSDNFKYIQCGTTEEEMLKEFLLYWQQNYPDIITGWNIDLYDIPFIINRLSRILGEDSIKKLSPWGLVTSRESVTKSGQDCILWNIHGVTALDYLTLYKKYTQAMRESYTLGYISQLELGDTKLELTGSFRDQIENQWDDFVRYNAKDSELITLLDERLSYIALVCGIAYLVKCNLADVAGPVKTWDIYIYNFLRDKNITIPPNTRSSKDDYEGAWVKEPIVGLNGWCMSFDAASLYPTCIRQWNMSTETLVKVDPSVNLNSFLEGEYPLSTEYTVAASGACFRKDIEGFLPQVMKSVGDGRNVAKKKMIELEAEYQKTHDKTLVNQITNFNVKQLALKTMANSAYGALANIGFRYYDLRIAEAITLSGQASTRHILNTLNIFMNKLIKTKNVDYVLMGDTDSVVLDVQPLVDLVVKYKSIDEIVIFLDKVAKSKIKEQLDLSTKTIFDIGNCYTPLMNYKREFIGSKIIITAKKRYVVMVHNSEGVDYKPYKLKVTGLEIVRSSTPNFVKNKLKDALILIFEKDQETLYNFVEDLKKEFYKLPAEDIAFPRTANEVKKWKDDNTLCKKGTPIHIRGSLVYNKMIQGTKDATIINNGDKIKFLYLKLPNLAKDHVVAFPSYETLPQSLNLHKYIDYKLQWEKSFIIPLKNITNAIGWHPERYASLESFFE